MGNQLQMQTTCVDQCNRLMVDLHDMAGTQPFARDPGDSDEVHLATERDMPLLTPLTEGDQGIEEEGAVLADDVKKPPPASNNVTSSGRLSSSSTSEGKNATIPASQSPAPAASTIGASTASRASASGAKSASAGGPAPPPATAAGLTASQNTNRTSATTANNAPVSKRPTTADPAMVSQLVAMGFSEDAAKKACIATGNSNLQDAMEAVLSADDQQEPSPAAQPAQKTDDEKIKDLMNLGFPKAQCAGALKQAKGNADLAASILLGAG
ncbi:unnamed protein product [Amoebophrya sp. A120]|nr:unnamed protein product [Amoebophrya sp. A120]|eukprot:GSA120T00006963001.1